ncbi:eisosome protein 1 [Kryptolebias marmoratus]|uniref:eisosome protein 1 n=1 Tax=Kryptolebias marmoratus TaxID=37003 RepID=UPI000D5301ED|nr:eisosome protein 1 [Kryptolebias marmoratus]
MSSSHKQKQHSFGSDVHRLLLAAEAAQKADILTYSSGHLGPRSLNRSQPPTEMKDFLWSASQSQEENPNSLALRRRQTKTLASVKKREIKASPSKITSGSAFVESEISRSAQDQDKDYSSHAGTRDNTAPAKTDSNSLSNQLTGCSQKESDFSFYPEGNKQFALSRSDHKGLNNEEMKLSDEEVTAEQDICAGRHAAEVHERKLQEELKKLSEQNRPSRDRLAVFSDVFDDVCEGSPVFGRILREIKTEYDLYVNHLMDSQSSQHDMLLTDVVKGMTGSEMELGDAVKEVCRLEQEARRALEENKRLQNELQNTPAIKDLEGSIIKTASLSELQDSETAADNPVQFKRLQVLNAWKEIRELEEEIREKLVSAVTTAATERRVKDVETERIKLIASNDRLRTINKDLQDNINMVLNREKASKAIRRMLWSEIDTDPQTDNGKPSNES